MKNVCITGAGRGIGRGLSLYFLQAGYAVAALDADQQALKELQELAGTAAELLIIPCDVSSQAEVKQAFKHISKSWDSLYGLINNAGISKFEPFETLTLDNWQQVLGINLTGPMLCSQAALPLLRKSRGAIVNIASTRAVMSEPDTEAYAASKGGLVALTHALAISLGPDVRVNCVSPGWIDVTGLQHSEQKGDKLTANDHSQHPAGRVGQAEDVARLAEFLLDPTNDFITGQNYLLDGGMTRKMIYS